MVGIRFQLTRRIALLVALVALGAMGGCASVPMASSQQDTAAKQFHAPADKSRIYLYRNETFGSAIKMAVSLDGKSMGQTGPHTYFMWDVAPGRHTIESLTENTPKLTLDTKPGQLYFVWQEVKMGFLSPRSALHKVDRQTGEKGVMECRLAKSSQ